MEDGTNLANRPDQYNEVSMVRFYRKLPFYEYIFITISAVIMALGIGVFRINAKMITGVLNGLSKITNREVIKTVVTRKEIGQMEDLIQEVDPMPL